MGPQVAIISSSQEVALEVVGLMERRRMLRSAAEPPTYHFATTADDLPEFTRLGTAIFGRPLATVERVSFRELD
jgi:glutamate racemase